MGATTAAVELGAGPLTVAEIVQRAGVSRRTFYEIFSDRDDCLLAAIDEGLSRASQKVLPAFRAQKKWQEAIGAGLAALLELIDDEPAYGSLLIVATLGAGPAALERRAEVISKLVDAVDKGRKLAPPSRMLSRATAEGVVGAVLSILHTRLISRRKTAMAPLLGELMSIVVMPYLGAAAAAREARRPAPAPVRRAKSQDGDPLRDIELRLTHRTILVLRAIADNPGSSNRQVAEVAGVADQGQVSKLLSRLRGAGLVQNVKRGSNAGEANSWKLTKKGARLHEAILREAGGVA